jgi:CHRD domain-containing protein/PEP-CTERM motif-containing protein
MKRYVATFAGILLAGLFSLRASAHEIVYESTLSGANESPANGSLATGFARVTIDLDVLTMRVESNFADLQGTTLAAHIHCCLVPGGPANVGVATVTPSFTDFPLGVQSGTYDHTFDLTSAGSYNPAFVTANTDVAGAMNAFLNGMANNQTYFNIHTSSFQGGEIRGFFHVVPEPQSLALLLLGVGALLARRRA